MVEDKFSRIKAGVHGAIFCFFKFFIYLFILLSHELVCNFCNLVWKMLIAYPAWEELTSRACVLLIPGQVWELSAWTCAWFKWFSHKLSCDVCGHTIFQPSEFALYTPAFLIFQEQECHHLQHERKFLQSYFWWSPTVGLYCLPYCYTFGNMTNKWLKWIKW